MRLSTGVDLEVIEHGPLGGEPVLFLHGFPDSWFSFSRVLNLLPSEVHAIVPSQRGHGTSSKPDCCYRWADFAADAVALLDALRIERATVVGHSMGSFVAQRLAAAHPSRVAQLVLVGSSATSRTPPVLELAEAVKEMNGPIDLEFITEFQKSTLARAVPEAFLARVIRESAKVPVHVWRGVVATLSSEKERNQLDRITAPTLIIWGDKDELFARSDQDELIRSIPGAQLITYTGTGHDPHWEEPKRFVSDLSAFVLSAVTAG